MSAKQRTDVCVGDEALVAEYTVYGRYVPAQRYGDYPQPEEWPEVEVTGLYASDGVTALHGLLEFTPVLMEVQQQLERYVADHEHDGPDPDEAYDRAIERERLRKEQY